MLTRREAAAELRHSGFLSVRRGHINWWVCHHEFTSYTWGWDTTPRIQWREVLQLIRSNYPRTVREE